MSAYMDTMTRVRAAMSAAARDHIPIDKMSIVIHPATWAAVRDDEALPSVALDRIPGSLRLWGLPIEIDAKRDASSIVLRYEVVA